MALKRLISVVKGQLALNAKLPMVIQLSLDHCDYAAPEFKQMSWGRAVWNGHVVNVDGFKDGAYHVVDPVFGARWINANTF